MINLLPEEKGPDKLISRLTVVCKNLSIILSGLLFLSVAVIAGILLIQNSGLNQLKLKQEKLTASVKNMEGTEKSLFLLKERLTKIKTILASGNVNKDLLSSLDNLMGTQFGVTASEIEISPQKTVLLIQGTASAGLTDYLADLLKSDLYREITLTSFLYNPVSGYSLNLEVAQK